MIIYIAIATLCSQLTMGVLSFEISHFVQGQQTCYRYRRIVAKTYATTPIEDPTADIHDAKSVASRCCIIAPNEYQHIAHAISGQLSIPFIADMNDLHDIDVQEDPFLHAIVIEPYTYDNLQNYSIGITSLSDMHSASLTRSPRKQQKKLQRPKSSLTMKPIYIDFMPPSNSKLGRRAAIGGDGSSSSQPDLLLKAIRPNQIRTRINDNDGTKAFVMYDLTAGFGQDSLLVANTVRINRSNNGGRVHMVERNRIIATLLEDAMRRLKLLADNGYNPAKELLQCLSFECNDGVNVLTDILKNNNSSNILQPDVIYLDPMFPIRRKSASVKKNMQILHGLLQDSKELQYTDNDNIHSSSDENAKTDKTICQGQAEQLMRRRDDDESMLLRLAYQVANCRVVVKRPIHAPYINATNYHYGNATNHIIKPSYQILGSINRWDVYIKM